MKVFYFIKKQIQCRHGCEQLIIIIINKSGIILKDIYCGDHFTVPSTAIQLTTVTRSLLYSVFITEILHFSKSTNTLLHGK